MISLRRRRLIVAAVATIVGVVQATLAAVTDPVIRLDEVRIHLGQSGDVVSRYVLLVAAVLLFASVRGLLRGNRLAWDVAVVATALGFLATQARDADGLAVLGGVAMVGALTLSWSACTGRSETPTVRRGAEFLVFGLAGAYLYGVAGLYLLDAQFSRSTTLLGSMADAAGLLVWVAPTDLGRAGASGRAVVRRFRSLRGAGRVRHRSDPPRAGGTSDAGRSGRLRRRPASARSIWPKRVGVLQSAR